MSTAALDLVRRYWALMASNDFPSVAAVLADAVVLDWPQSNERFRGADCIARMNEEYPAHGRWRFTVNRIVAGDADAVSDVSITDGTQRARAISFFTLEDGKIARIVEFWPEPYPPPEHRKHLAEPIE